MPEEKENTEQQPVKKNKTLLFIIIGAVVFMLILIIVAVIFLMGGNNENIKDVNTPVNQVSQNAKKVSNSNGRQSDLLNIGPLYAIPQPFVVNLVTQSGRRYLKTSITLELNSEKLKPEIDAKSTIIQDTIIEILSSKSIEEIATTKGKERLKDEIVSHINDFLIDGQIKNVFFTEFVIQ